MKKTFTLKLVLAFCFITTLGLVSQLNAQVVTHPIGDFTSEPNYFTYNYEISNSGSPNYISTYKEIRYFLILAPNSQYKSAFDATNKRLG